MAKPNWEVGQLVNTDGHDFIVKYVDDQYGILRSEADGRYGVVILQEDGRGYDIMGTDFVPFESSAHVNADYAEFDTVDEALTFLSQLRCNHEWAELPDVEDDNLVILFPAKDVCVQCGRERH